MKSFSSSAINKSGKKFAPKAPVRRAAPVATGRRSSATQQTPQAQLPKVSRKEKDVVDTIPPPSASPVESAAPTAVSEPEATIAEPVPSKETPVASKSAKAIPTPRPKRKHSISKPSTHEQATVITPTAQRISPSRHSTSQPQIVPSIEREPERPRSKGASTGTTGVASDVPLVESEPRRTPSAATKIRPAKRAKKASETTVAKPAQKAPNVRARAAPATITPTPQPLVPSVEETNETQAVPSTPKPIKAAPNGKKRKTSKAGTSEVDGEIDQPKPVRRRKREPTPEGAETVEILPNVIKMSELCKDLKTGKKSRREMELRKMELAEQERKQQAQYGRTSAERTPLKQNGEADSTRTDRLPDIKPQSGPVMRIVNGEIVLDTASLQVDRHAHAARSAGDLEDVVENALTRKINQASYGKRSKTEAWDEELTDLFYRGLRMFGTDFMVISKLFPGRSRHQIKLKFNNEERRDPQRIRDALLGPREPVDIATYSEMTNTVYDDPKAIQQELDDEKQRIEDQHAKDKAMQEELLRNPAGAANDSNAASGADKAGGAVAKGRPRNNKKQTIKSIGGGTEEVLGSIDDVPMAA